MLTLLFDRQYKSAGFAQQLLDILKILRVPSWFQTTGPHPIPSIEKVSGSLTNAVYFVSSPSSRTLLLRVYGPSSGSLISRPRELHVLHVLSSRYELGPRIYGTFTNGRIEEYFDSVTLKATDIREPRMSGYIGARMAELHSVDIATVEPLSCGSSVEIGVWKNVQSWLPPARGVLAHPGISPAIRKELDLDAFQNRWDSYVKWLKDSRVDARPVFCHNDAQYGNILRLNKAMEGAPDHHQVHPSRTCLFVNSDQLIPTNRSSSLTLSTLPQTQPPLTSRIIFTSGQLTTMVQRPTCLILRATRAAQSGARSSPPILRTAPLQTPQPLRTGPPRRASVSSPNSTRPFERGAPRRTPCGQCGGSSRHARTSKPAQLSPSLTTSIILAAASPRSIASLLRSVYNRHLFFLGVCLPLEQCCR